MIRPAANNETPDVVDPINVSMLSAVCGTGTPVDTIASAASGAQTTGLTKLLFSAS